MIWPKWPSANWRDTVASDGCRTRPVGRPFGMQTTREDSLRARAISARSRSVLVTIADASAA